jgi:hypothetical protein
MTPESIIETPTQGWQHRLNITIPENFENTDDYVPPSKAPTSFA